MVEIIITLIIIFFQMTFFKIKKSYALLFFILILYYIPRNTAPTSFFEDYIILRWISYFLITSIGVYTFLWLKVNSKKIIYPPRLILLIILFSLITIISSMLNNSRIVETIATFFLYLRYPVLLLIVINLKFSNNTISSILFLFFSLVIIQIPELIIRIFLLGYRQDWISLTLGPWGTIDLTAYMLLFLSFIGAKARYVKLKLHDILIILLFFIFAAIGEIKGFLFSAPIIFFLSFNSGRKMNVKKIIAIPLSIIAITILIIGYLNIYSSVFGQDSTLISSFTKFDKNETNYGVPLLRRITSFSWITKDLYDKKQLFFGTGPGSSMAGTITKAKGVFYENKSALNQFSAILYDVGLLGTIIYILLLFQYYTMIREKLKMINPQSKKLITCLNALKAYWIYIIILGPLYDFIWRQDSANFIFVILLALFHTNTSVNKPDIIRIKRKTFVHRMLSRFHPFKV